jgi:hypothetical protein
MFYQRRNDAAMLELQFMLRYVMLCYVMLCYVMLCYVMLCYVTLRYVTLCCVVLCCVVLCCVMLCYVMLCYVMLCYVMLCYVMLHPVLNVLYFYFSTFRSMRALRSMTVFCNSLADTLLRYFLYDFEMFPVAHVITGITSFLHSTCVIFIL